MMAKWEIIDREYHNDKWDLLHVKVTYSNRVIINRYKVLKDEKRVPRELMKERKWDTRTVDGKKWIEGRIPRRRR
jgi:hypothetical protein